jgi:hypothetical protein
MRINRDGDQISIRMWELGSGKRVHQFARPGMVPTLAFLANGATETLATATFGPRTPGRFSSHRTGRIPGPHRRCRWSLVQLAPRSSGSGPILSTPHRSAVVGHNARSGSNSMVSGPCRLGRKRAALATPIGRLPELAAWPGSTDGLLPGLARKQCGASDLRDPHSGSKPVPWLAQDRWVGLGAAFLFCAVWIGSRKKSLRVR